MEKAVVSENRVIPIPHDVSLREAALLGCAVPTGAGVIFNDMKIKQGQSLIVFGIGGIGISALMAAHFVGAFPIIAVDVQSDKLERAQKFGATHVIHSGLDDLKAKLAEILNGKGADFSLECAGRKEVMEAAIDSVKPGGGCCVIAGNLPKGERIQLDPFDLIRGKRIIGTWGGGANIDQDVHHYVNIFLKQESPIKKMISHTITLEEINTLMEALNKGQIARGLIQF